MIYVEIGHAITDHAIFACQNSAHLNALDVVSSETPGYPGSEATNGLTYGGWKPDADPASISYDNILNPVDYLGIAAHTLGTDGATVELFLDAVSIGSITPTDDSPILFLFTPRIASAAEVVISGFGGDHPLIGVIKIGARVTMDQLIYGGVTPPNLARVATIRPYLSETGKILGRPVIRQGYSSSPSWQHLPAAWYRSTFDPLVELIQTEPFFFAWRPLAHADELIYGQTAGSIAPSNMGIGDLMEVTVPIEGVE
jgi:hypothetical protein